MDNPDFNAAGLTVFERGWLSSNNVLFFDSIGDEPIGAARSEAGGRSVLVDSGYATHAPQTVALVRRALGPARLGRIVNTHLHSDHCGGNFALQQAFGCGVDVPAGEAAKVDRWNESELTYRGTGQQCPRFTRSGSVRGGDTIQLGRTEWKVLAAPGHDPESVVLYQPEHEILISADALWENGFGVVFPELEGASAFDDVGRTLDAIAGLRVRWIIPGHGAPFRGLGAAIERARSQLDSFKANPARHARHAAKVLMKFHLLELGDVTSNDLFAWEDATDYLSLCHRAHFCSTTFRSWCAELVGELAAADALRIDGDRIINN
jgi:glyoxylase-like metal-dependent hydrolase (beta-lactamase superfamily II)